MRKRFLWKYFGLMVIALMLFIPACQSDPQEIPHEPLEQVDVLEPQLDVVEVEPFDKAVVGYFIEWGIYARGYNVWDVPAEDLSHLLYAFAEVSPENGISLLDPWADINNPFDQSPLNDPAILNELDFRGNFAQLVLLKHRYPHLKTLISIGGWTKSGRFSDMASTAAGRKAFALACADFVVRYQFDGIDIDWEYPVSGGMETNSRRAEDKENYTLMMQEIRIALDRVEEETGKEYLLTAATTAGVDKINNIELSIVQSYMDYIFIMAYDFFISSHPISNHQGALYNNPRQEDSSEPFSVPSSSEYLAQYNADAAVMEYLKAGVDPEKLVLGVPMYGRAWYVEPGQEDGIFRRSTGVVPQGTWEDGILDYDDIRKNYLQEDNYFWDEVAQASYLYDDETGLFISYDSPQSVTSKAEYVLERDLGGMMFWEVTQDREEELIGIMSEAMR